MKNISASIVIYNPGIEELEKSITSFLSSTLSGTLYIIDNSPTQDAKKICDRHDCVYIHTGENMGYGRAHNLALTQTVYTSKYHLVLNPDVYFEPTVLRRLFDFMEANQTTGLVMPKVLYPDGTVQRLCKLLPTPLNLFTRRFLPQRENGWLKTMNDQYEMRFSNYNSIMSVPFLSGCFMFMRTSVLKETGLFDERFFLYAEDTDLSRRIHLHAGSVYYPFTEIYHTHGKGSYKTLWLTWCNLKSASQYFNKWGWFFDRERVTVNNRAATSVQRKKTANRFQLAEVAIPQPCDE